MHLILMTRGINDSFERWKKFMETQWFLWARYPMLKDKDGKYIPDGIDENGFPKFKVGEIQPSRIQGSLRPIQLFEYVFPKDGIRMVNGKPEVAPNTNFYEALAMMNCHSCFPLRKEISLPGWALRKMMGAKPIPQEILDAVKDKKREEITEKFVPMDGHAVYPIGIRDDSTHDYQEYGYRQEGL